MNDEEEAEECVAPINDSVCCEERTEGVQSSIHPCQQTAKKNPSRFC